MKYLCHTTISLLLFTVLLCMPLAVLCNPLGYAEWVYSTSILVFVDCHLQYLLPPHVCPSACLCLQWLSSWKVISRVGSGVSVQWRRDVSEKVRN